jgi:2-C-methyl-D-erythritol 4-phosphate cytidylyltransferase
LPISRCIRADIFRFIFFEPSISKIHTQGTPWYKKMSVTTALIMAAGSGERFGEKSPKQFCPLNGYPALAWNLRTFSAVAAVTNLVVVITPGLESRVAEMVDELGLEAVGQIVPGGETRQESVRRGLEALADDVDRVLVHDAARPCISGGLIERVCTALETCAAVVPVVPVVDTLILQKDAAVDAVLDRSRLACVQTPQGFRRDLLVKAHRRAVARGLHSSDDGSLVFAMGEPVRVVHGEPNNIKITYRGDVAVAEAILARSG